MELGFCLSEKGNAMKKKIRNLLEMLLKKSTWDFCALDLKILAFTLDLQYFNNSNFQKEISRQYEQRKYLMDFSLFKGISEVFS